MDELELIKTLESATDFSKDYIVAELEENKELLDNDNSVTIAGHSVKQIILGLGVPEWDSEEKNYYYNQYICYYEILD